MKKVAIVFVLAVFVPSLVLAWLAVRSLQDQQFVLERQRSLLYQNVADAVARDVENTVISHQHEFALQVEAILAGGSPVAMAMTFDVRLQTNWPLAEVGFVVAPNGSLACPSAFNRSPAAQSFLAFNGSFLANRESAEVYWSAGNTLKGMNVVVDNNAGAWRNNDNSAPSSSLNNEAPTKNTYLSKSPVQRSVNPQQQGNFAPSKGQVQADDPGQQFSKLAPAEAEFRQLIGDATEGTLARFVNDKLNVLFWYRSPRDSNFVFGAQLALPKLIEEVRGRIQSFSEPYSTDMLAGSLLHEQICLALLDDKGRPVAVSHRGFQTNWKRPFVSTEVGQELPHWEVAAYLLDPAQLTQSAQTLKWTLGLLVAVLLVAIGVGSWLIVRDLNRQLALARQKTDFVSNVSHELKTPLTSIRMFSELLAEQRVTDPAKQRSYLNIITAETARLTRLINNVLDFSRMERGEKKYSFRDGDLVGLVRETAETYRPHLENAGFKLECDLPAAELPVRADTDAVAQIIVNLLSNAEKYSNSRKEICVRVGRRDGPLPCAEVTVMDRGLGVPGGSEERIFEQFYRAHDSLSSGIQGSGLGLTLARQIARAHGGDVVYESRDGGGSCFSLRLPIVETTDKHG